MSWLAIICDIVEFDVWVRLVRCYRFLWVKTLLVVV